MMTGGDIIISPTAMMPTVNKFCCKFLRLCSGVVEVSILQCLFLSFRNDLWSTDTSLSFSKNGCIEVVSDIIM